MKNNWLRKIMMISAMAAFGLLAGCNNDDVTYDKAQVVVTPSPVVIEGGSIDPLKDPAPVDFEVDATRPWTAVLPASSEWLKITAVDGKPESGGIGKKILTATASVNATGQSRTISVVFVIDYRTSTTVAFTQKAENEVPAGELIYNETAGTQAVSGTAPSTWPFVADYTGWAKTGKGATNVTYSGTSASIRTSTPSKDYEGASGANIVFFGGTSNEFIISKIGVAGETNLQFKFGIADNSGTASPWTSPVTAATVTLSASLDGVAWTPITYTNANTATWVLATSEFQVPSGATNLYIKFANAQGSHATEPGSKIRVDDFSLYSGGPGGQEIGAAVTVPTVTASAATAVGETTATIGGTFTAPTGVTVTEAGVEWKKTADATYTKVPVAGAATGVAFTHDLTGLVKATSYTYRAYATTADATTYSGEAIFNTTDPARVYKTIEEVRTYPVDVAITDDAYVKGIVVGSGNSVDVNKNIVIQDATGGIMLRAAAVYAVADGDELEVPLNGLTLSRYQNGVLQLGNIPIAKITTLGSGKPIVVTDITAEQLITGDFESRYVLVAGVQVKGEDLSKKIGSATAHTTIKVETATQSFDMFTSKNAAAIINENVPQGSGALKGIASVYSGVYQIMPTVATDFNTMTGTRFGGVSFGEVTFEGVLKATEPVPAGTMIKVPYFAALGTEVFNVTVASTDAGITIADMTATLAAGSGSIEIPVAGTPTAVGEVTFTISGITGLTANTVKETVLAAGAGDPFEAYWSMQGIPAWGISPMPVTANDNTAVTVGDLTRYGFTESGIPGDNNWGGTDFSGNTDAMASAKYTTFAVQSATQSLSLESLDIICRLTKVGPYSTSIQYSVAGGAYVEAKLIVYPLVTKTTTFPLESVDLTGQAALQNIAVGTEVTFRIVPVKTDISTGGGNWYITNAAGGQGLTIKGSTK